MVKIRPRISPAFGRVNPLLASRQEMLRQLRGVATALVGSDPENGCLDLCVLCPDRCVPSSLGQEARPEAAKTW